MYLLLGKIGEKEKVVCSRCKIPLTEVLRLMRRRDQVSYLSIAVFYRLKDLISTFLLFKGIPGQPGHDGEPGDRVSIYLTCIFKHQYCYDCAISN